MLFWQKCLLISGCVVIGLALLVFILVFVVFPIVFMLSIKVQRFFMFFNVDDPKEPEFNYPKKYGIEGVNNFYITVKDMTNNNLLSIGAWQITPEPIKYYTKNIDGIFNDTSFPILLYFHGVACNRIKPMNTYNVLRKYFHIIAIDYRDFGDSTIEPLSEDGVVDDIIQVYDWVRGKTTVDIYVWGHSLGTALSTHVVKSLKNKNIIPTGLVLESPFSTMREEILSTSIGRFFSWLAYFTATVLNPLEENGFHFKTTSNILNVDCPIMILHAEDDNVIPYTLGKKLYDIAIQHRLPSQGNVTYYQFEACLGYQHLGITQDPRIPEYVKNFIAVCKEYNIGKC